MLTISPQLFENTTTSAIMCWVITRISDLCQGKTGVGFRNLGLIPGSVMHQRRGFGLSPFTSPNTGFFIYKMGIFHLHSWLSGKLQCYLGSHTQMGGMLITNLYILSFTEPQGQEGLRNCPRQKMMQQFLQRFSENPWWVSKSWRTLFLHRDLVLKYGTDIFKKFLYCYVRYFLLIYIKKSTIYGFFFTWK